MNRLVVHADRCIGCGACEKTCSSAHLFASQAVRVPRIRVFKKDDKQRVPITCLQCEDAACAMACQFGAITRNEKTGAMIIDGEKCTGCMACHSACPFGNILIEEEVAVTVKCDLCGGDPECVKTCPSKTLMFE